ncbi:Kynurenine formamidase [bioreactor metagenome]|uniref:Kynurenine formamidase n=1 Tax=bioreactor metagenome TaxID=1076179 RepID=A0A645J714_9ZZZZ
MHYNYFNNEKRIDNVPVDVLVGDALWVHFPDKKNLEEITAADLEKATAGKNLEGVRLVITTGYTDENWKKEDYFHVSPYLSVDSAEWMVKKKIAMVAIDFQTDKPGDTTFPVHNILLSNEIYILEYLTNIPALIKSGFGETFTLVVGVLKLEGLEAATARVFAIK